MSSMFKKKTGGGIKPKLVPRGRPAAPTGPSTASPPPQAPRPTRITEAPSEPSQLQTKSPSPASVNLTSQQPTRSARRSSRSQSRPQTTPPEPPAEPPAELPAVPTTNPERDISTRDSNGASENTSAATQLPEVQRAAGVSTVNGATHPEQEVQVASSQPSAPNDVRSVEPSQKAVASRNDTAAAPVPVVVPTSSTDSSSATITQHSQSDNTISENTSTSTLVTGKDSRPTTSRRPRNRKSLPDSAHGQDEAQAETQDESQADTQVEGVPGANATTPQPKKRVRKKNVQPAADGQEQVSQQGQDGQEAQDGQTAQPMPKRKRARKTKSCQGVEGQRQGEGGEDGDGVQNAAAEGQPKKKRRARSATPEDAENQVVDLKTLKMADLTKDLRIGRKFSRHDELKNRERLDRARYPLDQLMKVSESPGPNVRQEGTAAPRGQRPTGPTYRIENGQLVLDEQSLVVDRHARDAADGPLEDVEENEFTRKVTSNSYRPLSSKLTGPNHWTLEDTEKFYQALKRFGTDFQMISSLFPGRNRRHIKMKFNREEKFARARVDAAIVGPKRATLSFEDYQNATGKEYQETETIKAELLAQKEKQEEEERREKEREVEANKQRRAEITGETEGVEEVVEEVVEDGGVAV